MTLRNPQVKIAGSILVSSLLGGILAVSAPAAGPAPVAPVHARDMARSLDLFKSTVRPLIETACIECHGGEKIRSGLNLNSRETLLAGGDNGAAVIPGDAAGSLLIALIQHREEPFMPKESDEKLSDVEVSAFAEWIDSGAAYDKPILDSSAAAANPGPMVVTDDDRAFWSFRPLSDPLPPEPKRAGWAREPIDRFIAAEHETRGLKPAPEAGPEKLVRRIYFDLVGLPPAPEEVESFVKACQIGNQESEIENLVDRLLDSPRFGEKWARHWLDVARFAESHGFEQDYDRPYAYHYRDFVIEAFNRDMPFDQFVKWQLAGDEFAPGDPLAMMATGFLGAGAFPTQLTEKEFESARYDELDDMASTTGTAFLGLTIGCARCHDHKYDPIPTRDYYRLLSTFTTTIRSEIDQNLDPGTYERQKAAWDREHEPLVAALEAYEQGALKAQFETRLKSGALPGPPAASWRALDPEAFKSSGGATLSKLDDGSILASGENPNIDDHTITATTRAQGITALRIEALTHRSLPKNGPGRARNGNFSLSDLTVRARPAGDKEAKLQPVAIVSAVATHEQNDGTLSAKSVFDDSPSATGWAVDKGGIGRDQAIVVTFGEPIGHPGGVEIVLGLKFANNTQHSIGRSRISFSTGGAAPVAVGNDLPQFVAEAFEGRENDAFGGLQPGQRDALEKWHARGDARWRELHAAVAAHLEHEPRPGLVKVQVTSEGLPPSKHHADARGFPHFYPETYHLSRGNVLQKGEKATQGFLQVLLQNGNTETHWQVKPPEGSRTSFRRTALANWITDTDNGAGHLLARVIVNRLWHHHFGRGLVSTPNDFGFQGMRPTHPELLDYLAGELIRGGWRLKPLHKRIILSAAYRQASAPDPAMARIDPENLYLWRFSPRRLEAENIRDSLLAVGGVLDAEMFGPGTLDAGNPRRSVYLMIKRSMLVPMMQIFDSPEPLVSHGSRPSTTIAPQALLLMNNPDVRAWIDAFARRLHEAAPASLEDAIDTGYRIALGRPPAAAERGKAIAFLEDQLVDYKHAGRTDARLLALGDFAQVLVSLNEFVYVE